MRRRGRTIRWPLDLARRTLTRSPKPSPLEAHATMPVDPAVADEQHYLDGARAALAAMRERTLSLDAGTAGGGAVSIEYLKSALHRRARASSARALARSRSPRPTSPPPTARTTSRATAATT